MILEDEKKEKRSRYFKQYYEKNKDKINARKNERYRVDPEYCEIIKRSVKLHFALKKIADRKEHKYISVLDVNGRKEQAFPVREACNRFNREYTAFRMLIKKGYVPNGVKIGRMYFYTESQILFLRDLFYAIDIKKVPIGYDGIKKYCELVWDKPYVLGQNNYINEVIKGGKNERKARRSKRAIKFEEERFKAEEESIQR